MKPPEATYPEFVDDRPANTKVVVSSPGLARHQFGFLSVERVARDRLEIRLAFESYKEARESLQSGDVVEVRIRRGSVTRTMRGVAQVFRWRQQAASPERGILWFWLRILPTAEWRRP